MRSSGSSCVAGDLNDGHVGCMAWAWHAWDAANGIAAAGKLCDGQCCLNVVRDF